MKLVSKILFHRRVAKGYGRSRLLGRTAWSFVDQAVVSLGTFLTSIILARHTTPSEYGVYALLLTICVSVQLFNLNFSSYPLIVRLASARGDECEKLTTGSLVVVAALCLPLSGAVGAAMFVLGYPHFIPASVLWFFASQMQLATRRALLANLRHREAVIGDTMSFLGQALLVLLVTILGTLSLEDALYCMTVAATLGGTLQALQLRLVLRGFHPPHRWLLDNASLGGWAIAVTLVSTLRLYVLYWLIAAFSGAATVAFLQAGLNVFYMLNPITFSLINLIPQIAARVFNGGDRRSTWNATRPYILIALPPTIFYVVLVLLFSPFLLSVFYGPNPPYLGVGSLLPYLGIFTMAAVPTDLIMVFLLGVQETRLSLKINLVGTAAILISAPPLMAAFGVLEGSCIAMVVGEVVRLVVSIINLANWVKTSSPRSLAFQGLNLVVEMPASPPHAPGR